MANGYPTTSDLENLLVSAKVLTSAGVIERLLLARYIAAAIDEWEHASGWQPFLQSATDATRYYNPPGAPTRHVDNVSGLSWRGGGRILELDGGLGSLTTLKVGYSSSSAGTALTEGSQFWLLPRNAVANGVPYQRVEFASPQWGAAYSIAVTGKWGYCATASTPDDVWLAVLAYAAALALPEHASAASGGVSEIKLGNDAFRYPAGGQFAAEAARWQAHWEHAVSHHKRVTLGI